MSENPPAFPTLGNVGYNSDWQVEHGMTLRDWFAGKALNGGLVRDSYPDWQLKLWFGERNGLRREEIVARAAYSFADAMLAERKKSS